VSSGNEVDAVVLPGCGGAVPQAVEQRRRDCVQQLSQVGTGGSQNEVDGITGKTLPAQLDSRLSASRISPGRSTRDASSSEWVDREWRLALDRRGLPYIDPVPLDDPSRVPPPDELSSLHFNDAHLAYLKYYEGEKE